MLKKTNYMIFSKRRGYMVPELEMYDQDITHNKRGVYLGVQLDYRLNWKPNCDQIRAKALAALRQITPLLRSSLPIRTKILLYEAYVRSCTTQAAPAWAFISNINRLQVVQKHALRLIVDYDRDTRIIQLHSDNDMPTLRQHFQKLTNNIYDTAANSSNTCINTLEQYDPTLKLTPKAILQ